MSSFHFSFECLYNFINMMILLQYFIFCNRFKDGTKLESGDRVQLSEKDNKAVLSINSAKIEDAGEYKLVASNNLGEDNSTAAVNVSGKLFYKLEKFYLKSIKCIYVNFKLYYLSRSINILI